MSDRAQQAGFTLLEVVISLAVTVVVLTSTTQLLRTSSDLTDSTLTLGRLDEAAGQAMLALGSELRWARPDTALITEENESSRTDFVVAEGYVDGETTWSAPIIIRYVPSSADTNRNGQQDEGDLVRVENAVSRVLCRNVTRGGFLITRNGDIFEVQLTLFAMAKNGRSIEQRVETTIALVNR